MKLFEHPFCFVLGRLGGIILRKNATVGIAIFSSITDSAILSLIHLALEGGGTGVGLQILVGTIF